MTTYYYYYYSTLKRKMYACESNGSTQNSVKNMSNNKIAMCKSIIIIVTILF